MLWLLCIGLFKMARIERRFYKSVASNSYETDDYTPANGETLDLEQVGGNGSITPNTSIQITWDPGGAQEEIIFSTHGDATQNITNKKLTGDGTRKLRIKLVNDQEASDVLGAFWIGSN